MDALYSGHLSNSDQWFSVDVLYGGHLISGATISFGLFFGIVPYATLGEGFSFFIFARDSVILSMLKVAS